MRFDEFKDSTQKLCDMYGKNLNSTQVEFWFESVKMLDINIYKQAINQYIQKNKYMPAISDLLAEINIAKQIDFNNREKQAETSQRVPCDKCHGSGYVKYRRDGYEYLCTCNCMNGRKKETPYLKKFNDAFGHIYNEFNFKFVG